MNNGNSNTNNRTNRNRVRPVCCPSADESIAYNITMKHLIEAFEDCVKAKQSSKDCLAFFGKYETELRRLWQETSRQTYQPGVSKCFVVRWPVKREIFAADFADRVIHHWWALRVNPLLEDLFVEQGNVSKTAAGEKVLSRPYSRCSE